MELYKKLLSYAPERKLCLWLSFLFSIISAVLLILPFYHLWFLLRELIVYSDVSKASHQAVIILVLMLLYVIFYFFSLIFSHLLAFRLESNLRKRGVDALMKASFSFFDLNPSGKIRKIIDDNAADTHTAVAHLIPDMITAFLVPICMLALMFIVDITLGALLLLASVVGLFMIKGMMGEEAFMKKYQAALERMNAETVEYIRGIQVVKIFRATVKSFTALYDSIISYSKLAYAYTLSCRGTYVIFQVMFHSLVMIAVPIAIIYLGQGEPALWILAKIAFFGAFAGNLFGCFMRVMYAGMYQFNADHAVSKLEGLIGQMHEKEIAHGTNTDMTSFDIEFNEVSFKYEENFVLERLSFKLPAQKTYALVGSSGGGKSTIAKLICGFYHLDAGEIKIGGRNIESYTEAALTQNIAFVFQNSKLFHNSIFENVRMGKPEASRDEVLLALKEAMCDDILDKFEGREETVIGADGVFLSGGEIQRICIARAILKNAPIVILDEASAAADPENEYEIQQAFSHLMNKKTVLMIAHRLSSIRNVDEILLIDEGQVLERGSDRELMALGGRYAKLQNLFAQANQWSVNQ